MPSHNQAHYQASSARGGDSGMSPLITSDACAADGIAGGNSFTWGSEMHKQEARGRGAEVPMNSLGATGHNASNANSHMSHSGSTAAAGAGAADNFNVGDIVDGQCHLSNGSSRWFPGKITTVNADGTFEVTFNDGDVHKSKVRTEIRFPRRRRQPSPSPVPSASGGASHPLPALSMVLSELPPSRYPTAAPSVAIGLEPTMASPSALTADTTDHTIEQLCVPASVVTTRATITSTHADSSSRTTPKMNPIESPRVGSPSLIIEVPSVPMTPFGSARDACDMVPPMSAAMSPVLHQGSSHFKGIPAGTATKNLLASPDFLLSPMAGTGTTDITMRTPMPHSTVGKKDLSQFRHCDDDDADDDGAQCGDVTRLLGNITSSSLMGTPLVMCVSPTFGSPRGISPRGLLGSSRKNSKCEILGLTLNVFSPTGAQTDGLRTARSDASGCSEDSGEHVSYY